MSPKKYKSKRKSKSVETETETTVFVGFSQQVVDTEPASSTDFIKTKYTTTTGEGNAFAVLCTCCTNAFVPGGIKLRKKAEQIKSDLDDGIFLCPDCT